MAISLSDLTGASTSGNILEEAQSTADFLDSVPLLKNLADPSGATDAKQFTATKQPTALPLIDGEGYCYLPPNYWNYVSTPDDSSLDITGDITIECDFIVPQFPLGFARSLVAKYNTNTSNRSYSLIINSSGSIGLTLSEDGTYNPNLSKARDFSSVLSGKTRATVKVTWRQSDGLTQFFIKESDGSFTQVGNDHTIAATSIYNGNQEVEIGTTNSGASNVGSSIGVFGARIYASVDGTDKRLDIDFTSPRIPHGATEFKCETGQVVTVNTDGKNPAKVIKKPVLRFDGSDDGFKGLLNQTTVTDGCYAFAAFSVLGDGGEQWGRVLSFNPTGGEDYQNGGHTFILKSDTTSNLSLPTGTETGMFDDANGDILVESGKATNYQKSRVNDASVKSQVGSNTILFDEFNLGASWNGSSSTSIDLEYLAVFPATLTDSQADQVRNYINNRNKVFYRWDTDGYYFFDGAATYDGQVFTGSGSWNGRIVGSDNGDADMFIGNGTAADRPTTDGYKITFADNTDHFDIPSTSQAGWQIVGTSLGTFAYKVDSDAITELNLLGNAAIGDGLNYRTVGDLYGIMLLPESATNRDIEEARKLLIDRGASDGVATTSLFAAWYSRRDIVEFKYLDTSNVTYAQSAWSTNDALRSFPALDLKNCSNFSYAWINCSSLTQFPSGAKLGTEASNVNFTSAWQQSGLTSFSTPLPTATNCPNAWRETELTSFSTELPVCTNLFAAWYNIPELISFNLESLPLAEDVKYAWYNTNITSFNTALPKARTLLSTWLSCSSLTDFSADVFSNWNPDSITNGIFNLTWDGCTSLTAQSVENILVPIANSGKWATTSGLEGGTALTDATIDIDYDVTTGSLTAATLTAIETLNGRGWSVNINNEIIVPNILQLQPAAAYSLRSFDADADPTVVNVRRSSDGALSDFTASQVSDGTLTSWVGGSNLITYSNSFSTNWSKTSSSTLTGGQAGYDGTNDATEFYDSKSNSSYGMYQQFLSLGIDGQITASIYVKAGTVSTGQFDVYYVGGHTVAVSFDLSNGTVEAGIFGGSTRIPDAVGIDNVGNGWYRINLTDDNGSTDIQYLRVGLSSAGTIFIQDAQVVYGDAVTPYVETNSSPAGNGYVTTWYDQSTNGRDSTQSTASAQPLIVENGVLVTEGGEAALDFDGANDALNVPAGMISSLSDILISVVFTGSDGGSDYGVVLGEPQERIYVPYISSNTLSIGYSDSAVKLSDGAYSDGLQLVTLSVDDTTASGFRNSSAFNSIPTATASSSPPVVTSSANRIGSFGSQVFGPLNFSEIIIFNTDQSANRAAIEKNINDHFNIYS